MRRQQRQPLHRQRGEKGLPERAVLDDVAQRLVAHIAVVVVQEKRGGGFADARVGDPDVQDRGGARRHGLPKPQRGKHLHGPRGDRAGTPVEGRSLHRRRVLSVHHKTGNARARERVGQGHAHQPAAHDQNIRL